MLRFFGLLSSRSQVGVQTATIGSILINMAVHGHVTYVHVVSVLQAQSWTDSGRFKSCFFEQLNAYIV